MGKKFFFWFLIFLGFLIFLNRNELQEFIKAPENILAEDSTQNALKAVVDAPKSLMTTITAKEGSPFQGDEKEMVDSINKDRVNQGLSPVEADNTLNECARYSGEKLLERDTMDFGKADLDGLGQRIQDQGFSFVSIAVNFATGLDGGEVYAKLMENQENRGIMLNKLYTHVGIAVLKSKKYGKVWVQIFAQKVPDTAEVVPEDEKTMLKLVNEERKKYHLHPLKLDPKLTGIARLKSIDIAEKGYFDHHSPTYGSPFDMLKKFGVTYTMAAENLAGHQTVEDAHIGLMNSPGHRKNILTPGFTRIGIGVVKGSKYGKVFTQLFIAK